METEEEEEEKVKEFILKVQELCKEYKVKNVVLGFDTEDSFHGVFAVESGHMSYSTMGLCLANELMQADYFKV